MHLGETVYDLYKIYLLAFSHVFQVKEVAPRNPKDEEQFWKHDIKIARDYNRTFSEHDGDELQMRFVTFQNYK